MDQINFKKIPLYEKKECTHFYYEHEKCLYRTTKTSKTGVLYLACVESGCMCNARISRDVFERTNSACHAHNTHEAKAEYEMAFALLRETVKTDKREVRKLHNEALRTLSAEAAGMLCWEHCRKTLQRIRHDRMPLCRSLDELIDLLENNDEVIESYGLLRGMSFYQGAVNNQLIFANLELVGALESSFDIFVDATFKVTPFNSRQLLIILGELQGRPRPLVYAIMTGQTEAHYLAIFQFVRDGVFSFDGNERLPRFATSDFEQALRLALKNVWPQVTLIGCNFHFCQSLRRKASTQEGLATVITGATVQHTILKMFMRLSMLPLHRVNVGLAALTHLITTSGLADDFNEFLDYFQRTWIQRFPPETWVVGDRERRSNNNLEGYNNTVKHNIPLNPSAWIFLDSLLNLAHDASSSFLSDRQRNAPPSADRSHLSQPLREALIDLNLNRIDELIFLQRLACC